MPVGAPLAVSGRERGDTESVLDELDGTVSALSWSLPRLRHYGIGTAQSPRSISAPRKRHMTAHRREAAELQERGDSQSYLR